MEKKEKAPKCYIENKEKYPNQLLLFRCGDFYEAYCDDANDCSEILGVALTRGNSYRLTGFPFHALDSYLPKLIRAGKRVVICDKGDFVVEDIEKEEKTSKETEKIWLVTEERWREDNMGSEVTPCISEETARQLLQEKKEKLFKELPFKDIIDFPQDFYVEAHHDSYYIRDTINGINVKISVELKDIQY